MRHILGLVAISGLMACGGQIIDPIDPPTVERPSPPVSVTPGPTNPPPSTEPYYPGPYPGPYPGQYPTPQSPEPEAPEQPPEPGPWMPPPEPPSPLPAPSYVPGVAGGSACIRMPVGLSVASELHVIGVYEGPSGYGGGHNAGDIDVDVRAASTPVTLFLSSYEPVRWHLHLEPGAVVERTYVSSYYPRETTVDGVPSTAAITLLSDFAAGCSYGWEPERSNGGCAFTETINRVRATTGAIESSFQGSYTGKHFTVPYPGGAGGVEGLSGYDMRQQCTNRCASSAGPLAWESTFPGSDVVINGLTATTTKSTWGTHLRASRGASCGKRYFEVETSGVEATVGARYKQPSDTYPLDYPWDATTTVIKDARVGVALDLEAGTIQFIGQGASGVRSLGLWSYGEVVAGVDLRADEKGSATLIVEPPFKFTPPPGFSAGF